MDFMITNDGTGQSFNSKEEFLDALSEMIDNSEDGLIEHFDIEVTKE